MLLRFRALCSWLAPIALAAASSVCTASNAYALGDEPLGACCTRDQSCTATTAAGCNTGLWLIGVPCEISPCPPPVPCCNDTTGECTLIWPGPINLGTGTPGCPPGSTPGLGTVCEPNPCPRGACCSLSAISCSITSLLGCIGPDTSFIPGAVCEPSPCPVGSCCNSMDSSCQLTAPLACPFPGQFFVGGTCTPNTCPSGSCCSGIDGSCMMTGPLGCPPTGTFVLGGTCNPNPCPKGACCMGLGASCMLTGPLGCSGTYTLGGVCDPSPCIGACCAVNGSCSPTTTGNCVGSWMPGLCEPNPCPGACCNRADGTCGIMPQNICPPGHYWQGSSVCEPNPCPQPFLCCDPATGICTPHMAVIPGGDDEVVDTCTPGHLQLVGSVCTPNPCAQPGPCCSPMGTCTYVVQTSCPSGSTWSPVGSCTPTNSCPQPGRCCNNSSGLCSFVLQSACPTGSTWAQGGACSSTACPQPGRCCDNSTGACSFVVLSACTNGLWSPGGSCTPNTCPKPHACCNTTSGECLVVFYSDPQMGIAGEPGCPPGSTAHESIIVCEPNPCPQPAVAMCRDVTIDARAACVPRTITHNDVNNGSTGSALMLSVSNTGPFPIGDTLVMLTAQASVGPPSVCSATVHVLGDDCNHNGIPDTCDVFEGSSKDCNLNAIPDECECFWDNGIASAQCRDCRAPAVPPQDGQLSHIGGALPGGARVADDFYLCPGQMHEIYGFCGRMLTNSAPGVRKARLEFYDDCDGAPVSTPFIVFNNSMVKNTTPGANGYDVVEYCFDFCDDRLWLEGGRTYWVALIGLTDSTGSDSSFWLASPGDQLLKGSVPAKAFGTPGQTWGSINWGPWNGISNCCIGCVNMAFELRGQSCPLVWNNGVAASGAAAGGTLSGASGLQSLRRTADNFVLKPCADESICYIEAYIWTNCVPPTAFIEIYTNDCNEPFGPPLHRLIANRVTPTGATITIASVPLTGYRVEYFGSMLTLQGGRTYWLSAGVDGNGAINSRSYFAYNYSCKFNCPIQIGPGQQHAYSPTPDEWTSTGKDYAFRIAAQPTWSMDHNALPSDPPAPTCRADINNSGSATVQDVFDFLAAWFAGCP